MPGLRIDRNDPTALHEQAAAAIRRAIADGEALPGQRIPQTRDLAAVLGIDRNTVLRALDSYVMKDCLRWDAAARSP